MICSSRPIERRARDALKDETKLKLFLSDRPSVYQLRGIKRLQLVWSERLEV